MVLPTIFATYPAGNVAASLLDANFSFVEVQGVQAILTTGTADTYILTPSDAWLTSYAGYAGRALTVIFNATNTGSSTVNVSGLGAVALGKNIAGAHTVLSAADIVLNVPYIITCDGAKFWLSTPNGATSTSTSSPVTNSGYVTNRYYGPWGGSLGGSGVLIVTANRMYGEVFMVGATAVFTRIGVNVTTLEAATSARLGIYNFSGGIPTTLVADLGTISMGSTGQKEVTISQALAPGLYVLAALTNGGGTAALGIPAFSNGLQEFMLGLDSASIGASAVQSGFYSTQAFGALPASFPAITAYITAAPAVWLRVV